MTGEQHERQPGHTAPEGEGGGAMSSRGAQEGDGWKAQARDAREQAERNRPGEGVGGGGVAGAGTGGGGMGGGTTGAEREERGGDAGASPPERPNPNG